MRVLYCISGLASRLASGKAEQSITVEHTACYRVYAYSRNTELNYANDCFLSDVLKMWLIIVGKKRNVTALLQSLGFKNRKVLLFLLMCMIEILAYEELYQHWNLTFIRAELFS